MEVISLNWTGFSSSAFPSGFWRVSHGLYCISSIRLFVLFCLLLGKINTLYRFSEFPNQLVLSLFLSAERQIRNQIKTPSFDKR